MSNTVELYTMFYSRDDFYSIIARNDQDLNIIDNDMIAKFDKLINHSLKSPYSSDQHKEFLYGQWVESESAMLIEYNNGDNIEKSEFYSEQKYGRKKTSGIDYYSDGSRYNSINFSDDVTMNHRNVNGDSYCELNDVVQYTYQMKLNSERTYDVKILDNRTGINIFGSNYTAEYCMPDENTLIHKIVLEKSGENYKKITVVQVEKKISDYEVELVNGELKVSLDPVSEYPSIGLAMDVGGPNDRSFNQSAWEGLLRSEVDLGIQASYIEAQYESDYEINMETLSEADSDLVIAVGFMMIEAVKDVAEEHPNHRYAIIDASYGENTPDNVLGIVFDEHEGAYLAGYIAGKMTTTNKVGFVGGMDFYLINKYEYGFKAGVKDANPQCEVVSVYANSFVNVSSGEKIANAMYDDDVDIIYHASGATGHGIFEATKERGKWAIGCDIDQSECAPDNILTSSMKRPDIVAYDLADDLNNNRLETGITKTYGIAEGAIDIAPTSSRNVPEAILLEIEEIKNKIASGEIVVPENQEMYNSQYLNH